LIAFAAAAATAWRARLDPRHDSWSSRALVAVLTYLGPLLRSWERYRTRLEGTAPVERVRFAAPSQRARLDWRHRAVTLAFWSETGVEKEALLQAVIDFLKPRKFQIAIDQGWSAWDVEVHRGLWARAKVLVGVEYHGAGKRILRVRAAAHSSFLARLVLTGIAAAVVLVALVAPPAAALTAALIGGGAAAAIGRSVLRLGRVVHQVVEIAAARLGLSGAP